MINTNSVMVQYLLCHFVNKNLWKHNIGPCPEPLHSSPHRHAVFLEDKFQYILPSMSRCIKKNPVVFVLLYCSSTLFHDQNVSAVKQFG
jgi:hypothetical protein